MEDIVILLVTALCSVVFSFLIVTMFDTEGITDDALSRDLNQVLMQMATLTINIVFSPVRDIVDIGIETSTMVVTRLKWVAAFVLFTALVLMIHFYHSEMLTIADDGWTCAVVPVMKNIFTPLLQVARLMYALFAPIYNAFLVMHGQIFKAWYITMTKCNHLRFFEAIKESALIVKTFSGSLSNFFGYASTNGETGGNFMTNDLSMAGPFRHGMKALTLMEDVAICACTRFELVFNIAFLVPNEPHVAAALDNFVQTGVRIFQTLFRLLFAELPDIYLINFKYERFVLETGLALDSILFKAVEKMIQTLSSEFALNNVPSEGPFTIAAHSAVGMWHALTTVVFNGPIHLMSIFDNKKQTSFDVEMWSMGKSLSQFHKGAYSLAVLLQWFTYIVQLFVTSDNPLKMLLSKDLPVSLSCDWARDVAEYRTVPIYESVGCTAYYMGVTTWNIPFIVWGATVELVIKTLFTNEQDLFRTLQRWEGPSIAREKVYTCEERAAATAYNYTVPTSNSAYNNQGWIWTQDRGKCQCDLHYGTTLDEHMPLYDPWCGQPSLTFDVFANLDALVMHVSHGLLGPGFGDALPFVNPTDSIGINIDGPNGKIIDKFIQLPLVLPPLTRTAIESMRVLTRVALSWGDIVTGHWFNYPINCGHGLNSLQIEKKYTNTRKSGQNEWHTLSENEKVNSRWATCGLKKYSDAFGLLVGGSATKPLEICQKSNEKSNCMCSYMQPLTPTSACRCISRYPDLDVTASSQEVGDLIDKRFTSPNVTMHWCNSMIIEWTFQNTGAFADALDYIVSLGPINPTCDVMDRAASGESLAQDDEVDQRSKKTFLIANTPTLAFTGEFMNSDAKLNHIKDLYSKTDVGCHIIPAKEITITGNDGTTSTMMTQAEWSCDRASRDGSVSISSLDPVNAATSNTDMATKPGCRIWGRYDFFCSAGLYVRNSKRLTMNLGRQFIHNGMSVLSGNYADINFDTMPRLCDYERQMGALAAMMAGIIPNVSIELKQAFAKYINMILQVMYIQFSRSILVVGKMVTTIVMNFENLNKETLSKTFESAIDTLVDSYFWAFEYFWETNGELLNAVVPGSGSICASIVEVTQMIRAELKNGLLKLVAMTMEVAFQFVAAMTGNTAVIGPMFENIFKLWAKVQAILIQQMWQILGKVFDFFTVNGEGKEGFGMILKMMASTVCELLNKVMGTINLIIPIGWTDQECLKMGGSRRLQEQDIDITQKIAETLEWNGTSVCDHFMKDAAQYPYDQLRPLEKAKWLDCIELKYLGIQMQVLLKSHKFPDDIFYNWKRKYMFAFDTLQASKIILEHYIDTNRTDWGQTRLLMLEQGLDADLYIQALQAVSYGSSKLINTLKLTNLVESSLGFFDVDYKNNANPSEAAQAWQIYSGLKTAAETTSAEWTRRDMSQQMYRAKDAMSEMNQHLHNWWSSVGTVDATNTHTDVVFGKLKRTLKRGWHHLDKVNRKHHALKSPKITKIQTCQERAQGNQAPGWCTDCNLMDNAVEALIVQATGLGGFYTNVQTGFPFILENVSLYFNELAEYNSEFFDTTFTTLSRNSASVVKKDATRWTFYVAKDWDEFMGDLWAVMGQPSNTTCKNNWLQQVDKLLQASTDFLTVTNSSYVPFFGYSFAHMYNYLLFSTCNLEESIFVTTTNQEYRLEQMDTAVLVCLVVVLVIVTTTSWSILPLVWMANTVVIALIINFLYLYIVYGYMISCAPLTPYTLVEDINAWYHTRLDPGCFYKLFPNMAHNATEDTCLTCPVADTWQQVNIDLNMKRREAWANNDVNSTYYNQKLVNVTLGMTQSYQDCAVYIPDNMVQGMLTLPELMDEFFIFWPLVFWVRQTFPDLGVFVIEYGLVSLDSVVGKLAMACWQNEPIDDMWVDCYNVMWLDNVLAVTILCFVAYVGAKLSIVFVQSLIQIAILALYTYTSLGYISLTVEQSVVKKAKLM